ncbi:MAG: sigma-70 family RNA polymerase sigma factor [Rhodothermales bacterium]|nr:sigma-70 family RNA polymerase sigma factor [Rhodothermales bacterium]
MPPPDDLTALLARARRGDENAVDAVLPRVYDELHALAHRQLRSERAGHTLNTTALVHEAYLKLVDQTRVEWQNRAHFFAIAATAMRRILINYAHRRKAQKRGGGVAAVTLDEEAQGLPTRIEDLLALDQALDRLAAQSERQARVVELRFFAGLKEEEIAEALGVSAPTVRRDWRFARTWLSRELDEPPPTPRPEDGT